VLAANSHAFLEAMLTWTAEDPDRGRLRRHGFAVLPWKAPLEQFVAPVQAAGAAHARSLEVTPAQAAAGEGEQAERRVAYVALTRAQRQLLILHTSHKISPFGWQAGLAPPPPPPPRPAARTGRRSAFASASKLDPADAAREAIRAAPSRAAGLRTAARAVCDSSGPLSGVELIDVLVEAPAMSLARAHEILPAA